MDEDNLWPGIVVVVVAVCLIIGGLSWFIASRPTTYCTKWTRAVSIEPTNSDNGKHSDEQYIVKYEDGSITGQDQGAIPFARCTAQTRVHMSQKQPGWKEVNSFKTVDWQQ